MNIFESSIQQAIQDKRAAHLCIDNQAYFPAKNLKPKAFPAFMNCCQHITKITDMVSPYMTTVHVAYKIAPNYLADKKEKYPVIQQHCRSIFYDKRELKSYWTQPKNTTLTKIETDYLNPNFLKQHNFIKEYNDAFEEEELPNFLAERSKHVLFFSGMYLTACLKASLIGAQNYGFKPVLITDGALDFSDHCTSTRQMFKENKAMAEALAFQWGIPAISSSKLLRLCTP